MVVISSPSKGLAVETLSSGGRITVVQAGLTELVFGYTDALGQGAKREVLQRIGTDSIGHLAGKFIWNFAPIGTRQIGGGKEFRDRGHINAVKTGPHDRGAGHADVNFAGSSAGFDLLSQDVQSGGSDDGILDQEDAFALHYLRHRCVFSSGSVLTGTAFDECSADVAVAKQALDAR